MRQPVASQTLGPPPAADLVVFETIRNWFLSLGPRYGVDPIVFGAIYVGAIPFFLLSVSWLAKRLRAGRPIVAPVLCAGFCFLSAYLYLAIVGHGVPFWVWLLVGLLVFYGTISTVRDVRRRRG